MLPFRTDRLLLRPFTEDDAPLFAAYRSEPEVARYQSWEAPYSLDAARGLIGPLVGKDLSSPEPGAWNQIAVQLAGECTPVHVPVDRAASDGNGTLIGDCVFRLDPDDPRQASIGFTLSPTYQRRGYATEAVRGLLGLLFRGLGLHRVTAVCDVRNVASRRVLERVGMRCEATFVENIFFKGSWGSELSYAMLRREWGGEPGR